MSKRKTVNQLAEEAGLEPDDALIRLWDAGFAQIIDENAAIGAGGLNRARRALGLATRRELKDAAYWRNLFNLDEVAFQALCLTLEIRVDPRRTKQLSARAIGRLRAEAKRREIDPITARPLRPKARAVDKHGTAKPLLWRHVGRKRDEFRWLNTEEVLHIHNTLVADFAQSNDPIEPSGPKNATMLPSAVFRPQTSLGDELKYPTVEMSAAALLHSVVHNHPFHNGNKRTALVAMLVFLDENGLVPTCDEDELFKLVLRLAKHKIVDETTSLADREVLALSEWLVENTRTVECGERSIPFRRLRQVLADHGCEFRFPNGVGNRLNITREVARIRAWGLLKTKQRLSTQIYWAGENQDVSRDSIKKVREDLQLDDAHGVDSRDFYKPGKTQLSEFIAKYRKTLDRLARM